MYGRAMLYGRLADPDCTLGTDPRADPRMVKAFAQFGLDRPGPEIPLTVDSPLEDRLAWALATEEGFAGLFEALAHAMPIAEGVTTRTVTIAGRDGNDITLYISRPADAEAALPAVVHLHGGGMAILERRRDHNLPRARVPSRHRPSGRRRGVPQLGRQVGCAPLIQPA